MIFILNSIKKILLEGDIKSLFKEFLFKLSSLEFRREYIEFNESYQKKQWNKAIKLGETIVKTSNENEEVFRKLAVCYKEVGDSEYAQYYMKKSLDLISKSPLDHIINVVEESAFSYSLDIKSNYHYLGGAFNLGFIKHTCIKDDQKYEYLTKIIQNSYPINLQASKEHFFHQVIRKDYPKFKDITVEMINYMEMEKEKLILITFEKLNNDEKQIAKLKDAIKLVESLADKIKYNNLVEILKTTDRGRMIPLSSSLHKLSTHKFIIEEMKNNIKKFTQKSELEKITNQIEHIMINLKLYEKINPKQDYVFCHLDLNANNILCDDENSKHNIIDWSTYGFGLRGHDTTTFLCDYGLNFQQIKDIYLDDIGHVETNIELNKLFCTYNLLILWIQRLELEDSQEQIEECIRPAVTYMEELSKGMKMLCQ